MLGKMRRLRKALSSRGRTGALVGPAAHQLRLPRCLTWPHTDRRARGARAAALSKRLPSSSIFVGRGDASIIDELFRKACLRHGHCGYVEFTSRLEEGSQGRCGRPGLRHAFDDMWCELVGTARFRRGIMACWLTSSWSRERFFHEGSVRRSGRAMRLCSRIPVVGSAAPPPARPGAAHGAVAREPARAQECSSVLPPSESLLPPCSARAM